MNNMEDYLRKNMTPDLVPDDDLNASITKQAKELKEMKKRPFKYSVAAAAFVGILTVGSVSAYAAYRFLTPSQVAENLTESTSLAKAFESEGAVLVDETQSTAGYNVTLLGTVTGKDLLPSISEDGTDLNENKTYVVVAIEKADGSLMPATTDKNYQTFCVSPLIHGKDFMTVNNGTLNAGVISFVQDGVQYELLECDDLQIFSGMGVSLGVLENFGEEPDAFCYDTATGLYSVNPDFDGMNALFELPLDETKADMEAANAYFAGLEEEDFSDEDTSFSGNQEVDEWIAKAEKAGNSTNADWNAVLSGAKEDEAYTQTVKPDEEGYVFFMTRDGESENQYYVGDWQYESGVEVFLGADSDGTMKGTQICTLMLQEDGTFVLRYYQPI
ncbi:MAG: hypothetical protein ACI4F4_02170 [Lachnospiraceae bacterium]